MHYFATSFHLLLLLGVLLHLTPLANGAPGPVTKAFVGALSVAAIMSPAAGAQPVDGAVAVQHIQPMNTLPGAPEWTPLPSQTHTMPPSAVQKHVQGIVAPPTQSLQQSCKAQTNYNLTFGECEALGQFGVAARRGFKWIDECDGCILDPTQSSASVEENAQFSQQSCVAHLNYTINNVECYSLKKNSDRLFDWNDECGCVLHTSSSSASAGGPSPWASVAAAGVAASALLLGGPQGANDKKKRKPSLKCSRASSKKAAGLKI